MLDIKIFKFLELAEVSSVRTASDLEASQVFLNTGGAEIYDAILVTGSNFNRVVDVVIDGVKRPYYVVNSKELLTVVPKRSTIGEVFVVTDKESTTNSTTVDFSASVLQRVTGPEKTAQQFIKFLLTSRGSDIFDPTAGGDLNNWSKGNTGVRYEESAKVKAAIIVNSCADAFKKRQSSVKGLPPEEKLLSATVTFTESKVGGQIEMGIELRMQADLETFVRFVV